MGERETGRGWTDQSTALFQFYSPLLVPTLFAAVCSCCCLRIWINKLLASVVVAASERERGTVDGEQRGGLLRKALAGSAGATHPPVGEASPGVVESPGSATP